MPILVIVNRNSSKKNGSNNSNTTNSKKNCNSKSNDLRNISWQIRKKVALDNHVHMKEYFQLDMSSARPLSLSHGVGDVCK